MKRKVDKSKKSNIKCEHCEHFLETYTGITKCLLDHSHKNYWNRCKSFEWKHDTPELLKEDGK